MWYKIYKFFMHNKNAYGSSSQLHLHFTEEHADTYWELWNAQNNYDAHSGNITARIQATVSVIKQTFIEYCVSI